MHQDTSSPAYLWAQRRRLAGGIEYDSWHAEVDTYPGGEDQRVYDEMEQED